jgi:hypothetical protein
VGAGVGVQVWVKGVWVQVEVKPGGESEGVGVRD